VVATSTVIKRRTRPDGGSEIIPVLPPPPPGAAAPVAAAAASDANASGASAEGLKPGAVIDLRGSSTREAPAERAPKRPAVGPVGERVQLPPLGQVLDLRARGNRDAAPPAEPRPPREIQIPPPVEAPILPIEAEEDLRIDGNRRDFGNREDRGNRREDWGNRRDERGPRREDWGNRRDERGPRREEGPRADGRPGNRRFDDRRRGEERDRPRFDRERDGNRAPFPTPREGLPVVPDLAEDEEVVATGPRKDVTFLVLGHGDGATIGPVLEALSRQVSPWDTETLILDRSLTEDALAQFKARTDLRVVTSPTRLPSGKALDLGIQESLGDVVVVIQGDLRPRGEDWLRRLTDPMFDDETARVAVVNGSVVEEGAPAPSLEGRTFRRGDRGDEAADLSGDVFAVRKKVAMRKRFSSVRGDTRLWMRGVLDSGGDRRVEPAAVVERITAAAVQAAPAPAAPAAAPEAAKPPVAKAAAPTAAPQAAQAPKAQPEAPKAAPEPKAPPQPEAQPYTFSERKSEPESWAAPGAEESIELWEVPLKIASKTAEKWVHIATGLEQRSLLGALRAPFDAARDVLANLKR
jgi:hypothetical protein